MKRIRKFFPLLLAVLLPMWLMGGALAADGVQIAEVLPSATGEQPVKGDLTAEGDVTWNGVVFSKARLTLQVTVAPRDSSGAPVADPGAPIPGAAIRSDCLPPGGGQTGSDGKLTITGLTPGAAQSFAVSAAGYETRTITGIIPDKCPNSAVTVSLTRIASPIPPEPPPGPDPSPEPDPPPGPDPLPEPDPPPGPTPGPGPIPDPDPTPGPDGPDIPVGPVVPETPESPGPPPSDNPRPGGGMINPDGPTGPEGEPGEGERPAPERPHESGAPQDSDGPDAPASGEEPNPQTGLYGERLRSLWWLLFLLPLLLLLLLRKEHWLVVVDEENRCITSAEPVCTGLMGYRRRRDGKLRLYFTGKARKENHQWLVTVQAPGYGQAETNFNPRRRRESRSVTLSKLPVMAGKSSDISEE